MQHDFNPIHLLRAIRLIPSTEIDPLEKLILYTLLSCSNPQNDSWHTQESLAELTSTSKNTIIRKTKSLVQKKFIIIKIPPIYKRGSSNHYALNVDHIMFYCPSKSVPTESTDSTSNSSFNDHRYPQRDHTVPTERPDRYPQRDSKKQSEDTKEDACARDPLTGSALRVSPGKESYYVPDEIWAIFGRPPRTKNGQETH